MLSSSTHRRLLEWNCGEFNPLTNFFRPSLREPTALRGIRTTVSIWKLTPTRIRISRIISIESLKDRTLNTFVHRPSALPLNHSLGKRILYYKCTKFLQYNSLTSAHFFFLFRSENGIKYFEKYSKSLTKALALTDAYVFNGHPFKRTDLG